jgi:hypothetical protein
MDKNIREIDANGFKYLNEFPEFKVGLPSGIFIKEMTNVCGTFMHLNAHRKPCHYPDFQL